MASALFIDTTVLNTSGGGDYTVVASDGDDDFLMSATSGGDYDITMGKGIDEIWLSGGGAGEFASATIQLAVGDSAAVAGEIDVVDVASGDIVSGDIVFDFNLAAATNSNFELSSGDANVSGDATAITAATAAFAADTSLKYYVTGDGTDGWLFVNSKSGSAPEIAVKITGLGSTDNFTIDNISS